jgi:hypothetical protein
MHNFSHCFVAVSTLAGCIYLPFVVISVAMGATEGTAWRLITDRDKRDVAWQAVAPAVVLQVTFSSIATLVGAAVASLWWLIPAFHSHANPIAVALAGGSKGLIVSIWLSYPVLLPAVPKSLPVKIFEKTVFHHERDLLHDVSLFIQMDIAYIFMLLFVSELFYLFNNNGRIYFPSKFFHFLW